MKQKLVKPLSKFSPKVVILIAVPIIAVGIYMVWFSSAATTDTANMWMDSDGGSCAYSSNPQLYTSGNACADFSIACTKIPAGANVTVLVKEGTYTSSETSLSNCKPSGKITFRVATDENATASQMSFQDTNNIAVEGFYIDISKNGNGPGSYFVCTQNITLKNVEIEGDHAQGTSYGDAVQIWPRDDNTKPLCHNQNFTLDGVYIHDLHTYVAAQDNHTDCVQAASVQTLTIKNSKLVNCGTQSFQLNDDAWPCDKTPNCASVTDVVLENNMVAYGGTIGGMTNFTARNNVFMNAPHFARDYIKGVKVFTGNILDFPSDSPDYHCDYTATKGAASSVVFKYNIANGNCPAGINSIKVASLSSLFVNASSANSDNLDFHLTGNNAAIGAMPYNLAPTTDYDGDARPQSGNVDIGADQYNSSPPSSSEPTANLWVDGNGGSCMRSVAKIEYVTSGDAASCDSFDAAYKKANPGDLVFVKAKSGGYGTQTITTDASKASATNYVVVKAAPGESVTAGTISVGKTDRSSGAPGYWVEFSDMTISQSSMSVGSHHIIWRNINTNWVGLKDASFVSFIGGSISNNVDIKGLYATGGNPGSTEQPHDILIDGVSIHDSSRNAGVHTECVALWGFYNVIIRNSRFYHCGVYDISATEALSPHGDYYVHDWLVENNFFDSAFNTITGTTDTGDADLFFESKLAGSKLENIVVRNNSFAGSGGKPYIFSTWGNGASNIHVIGNVGGGGDTNGSCQTYTGGNGPTAAFATNAYNVFGGVDCPDAGGTVNTNTQQQPGFVSINPGSATGSDLHLSSTSKAIHSSSTWSIPSGYCPNSAAYGTLKIAGVAIPSLTTDIDGDTRPQGAGCDAGADEFLSGTTPATKPGDLNNDNSVNTTDLVIMLSKFGTTDPTANINGQGSVDTTDLVILLSKFGS